MPANQVFKKKNKNGLVHGKCSHLIKGPLGKNGLKEGAAGQLEKNHRED
jgi:hypothetical protein